MVRDIRGTLAGYLSNFPDFLSDMCDSEDFCRVESTLGYFLLMCAMKLKEIIRKNSSEMLKVQAENVGAGNQLEL